MEDEDNRESREVRMIPLAPLIDILDCIICIDMVKIPFKVCKTGHLMCKSCMATLSECPLCHEKSFWENLTVIKKLLESIPHPCRHTGNGCKTMVEPGDKHETFCESRSVSCKEIFFGSCKDKVPLDKLLLHYLTKHGNRHIFGSHKASVKWKNYKYKDNVAENLPITVSDHFFWLKRTCQGGTFEITFNVHPFGELNEDYYVSLKLNNGEEGLTYTLKANIDGEMGDASGSMCIPRKSIPWLINPAGDFVIEYFIYSVPKSD